MFIQGAVDKHVMRYAFKSAGENFNVFDDESIAVVVPYGRGEELITELNSEAASNPYILSKMLKEAEQYSVKIFDYQREKLEKAGLVYSIADGKIMAVAPNAYDAVEGLQTDAISASASDYIV
jgi:CRISPR-associated endonuclease/helicase Cas3